MEQNANNRLLNEEELEQVNGGCGGTPVFHSENFTCEWCGSHYYYWEPGSVMSCGECGTPTYQRREDYTKEELDRIREDFKKMRITPLF